MSTLLNFKQKRWPFIVLAWLLFIIQVHFHFKGLIMTKKDLSLKSGARGPQGEGAEGKRPKVVMLLVDALREDFVDMEIP